MPKSSNLKKQSFLHMLLVWLKSNYILVITLTIITIFYGVVYREWIFSNSIITHGDWDYHTKEAMTTLRINYFSTWMSDFSLGRILTDVGQAPTYALYGVLTYLIGSDYAVNERIIHLIPAILIAPLSSYYLVHMLLKDKRAALLGAIVYCFNTYFLALQTGHLTLAVAYAAAPLAVGTFITYTNSPSFKTLLASVIALMLQTIYEPRSVYIVLLLLMIYSICKFLVHLKRKKRIKDTLKFLIICALPVFILLLLNFYWIYGLISISGNTTDTVIRNSLFGSIYFNMVQSLTLFHPYWSGGKFVPFVINSVPIQAYLIPFFAVLGLYFNRRNNIILFFGVVGLIGILLSKQSALPFPGLYEWLFIHFPGFSAYREASKFYLLIALSYSILIPSAYLSFRKQYGNRYISLLLFIFISGLFLINAIPLINKDIGTTFVARSQPAEYATLNKFLNQDDYFRTFWLPERSRWGLNNANHPYIDSNDIVGTTWIDYFEDYHDVSTPSTSSRVLAPFNISYSEELFRATSVKYVIVPLNDIDNDDDFFTKTASDKYIYLSKLRSVSWLKEIDIGLSNTYIFENVNFNGYASSSNNLYNVRNTKDINSTKILASKNGDLRPLISIGSDKKYATNVHFPFRNLKPNNFTGSGIEPNKFKINSESEMFTPSSERTYYTLSDINLSVKTSSSPNTPIRLNEIFNVDISSDSKYLYSKGDDLTFLRNGTNIDITPYNSVSSIYRLSSNNLLPDFNTSRNVWSKSQKLCDPYSKSNGISKTETYRDQSLGQQAVSMSPGISPLCIGVDDVKLQKGEYLISFKYRVTDAQVASYSYSIDGGNPITVNIPSEDGGWHTYNTKVYINKNDSNLSFNLYGRPSDQLNREPMISYSDVNLSNIELVKTISDGTPDYIKTPVGSGIDKYAYTTNDKNNNLIENSDLKNGLWNDRVNDCNNFDNDPKISINLIDGKISNALELVAQSHVACTSTPIIPIDGNRNYKISFKYRSSNSKIAAVRINYSDANNTVVNKNFDISGDKWNDYDLQITAPINAERMQLTFFTFSDSDGYKKYSVQYKDFSVYQLPPVTNEPAITSEYKKFAIPSSITSTSKSATSKLVSATGVSGSFPLVLNELYHQDWNLYIIKDNIKSKVDSHFKSTGEVNGWYIDFDLCVQSGSCLKNADNTYSIDFIAEFSPQINFSKGLYVSLGTITILILLIPVIWRLKRK